MSAEHKYQITLTLVPNIGDIHGKALINHFGNAEAVFSARKKDLEVLEGIATVRANSIKHSMTFQRLNRKLIS